MLLAIRWLNIARLIVIGFAINAMKVDGKSMVPTDVEEQVGCGKRFFGDKRLQRTTIVNGNRADKGEYPWQVSLRIKHMDEFGYGHLKHYCGGTIIGDRYIITAAHCIGMPTDNVEEKRQNIIRNPHLFPIIAGDFDLQNFDYDYEHQEGEQILSVADIYVHDQYPNIFKDIAIIKTAQKIKFGLYAQPACLALGNDRDLYSPGDVALLSGWGSTIELYSPSAQLLQEAKLLIQDIKDCNETYTYSGTLTDDMVCAGYWTGYPNPAACSGDSGGPLIMKRQGRFYLTGIVSKGPRDCGNAGIPTVFTDVSKFEDWIKNHVTQGIAS